ncbi:SMP-30/gluconolactonase/LRE family protein [Sphingomonas sp. XMGL2]|uniref:SMP-30/gluconolactonase/LRE family protein n=1 Tax=Sphingomonas quercus TaxID=2842451 RepID=A0ABS6BN31_9SPHN|nr:SMP-30/gluconolactonase/LRE family protein [Sphingomonas quercus]
MSSPLLMAAAGAPAYVPAGSPVTSIPQPEDLLTIPGTSWVIAGSMRTRERPGHLYAFDATAPAPAPRALYPSASAASLNRARFGDCPGPLDDSRFTPHGIGLSRRADGSFELLVVNHGGRESIEAFDVTLGDEGPQARWTGCIVLPAGASGNGVVALPDGSIIVSKFLDKADPDFLDKMVNGQSTGNVLMWKPGKGWSNALKQDFSGANGVAVSADGRWLFVAEWSARKLWRFPLRDRSAPKSVAVDFLPDNLRLTDRGTILVAGQAGDPRGVMTCKGRGTPCPQGFKVVEMDPKSLRLRLLAQGGDQRFGGATGATLAGPALWIGAYYGETIARYAPTPR